MRPGRAGRGKPNLLRADRLPAPGGWKAGEHRNCPVRQKGNATGEASAAKIRTRRDRWVIRNPAGGFRVGDAASDPIRKQGTGVRSRRPIRNGWLVCAARVDLAAFPSGDGCRGSRLAPWGDAPAGTLTAMPTTVDNRGPGLDSGWLPYDDGYWCQDGGDAQDGKNSTRHRATGVTAGGVANRQEYPECARLYASQP